MPETYKFEFGGALFSITADNVGAGSASTTNPPNMRVIEGTWPTWRLEVDTDVPGIGGLRLLLSVDASGNPHPHGNLTPAQSAANSYMLMAASDGRLYQIANGYGAISRLYTTAEWRAQLSRWEANL